ncbi:Aldo/keto reductase family-domain-containing protein [Aspergillus foveolatus]|uniref:Aldo/keto reductase family-domain-containing protein n=1 Tax=Aspergillus foveolatus TaxID=210207 RepID=UPI003CCD7B46
MSWGVFTSSPSLDKRSMANPPRTPLSQLLPPLILGGAGFSYQHTQNPNVEQTREVVSRAFEQGVRAIDTSPYYEPSEALLGEALSHPDFTTRYRRSDFILMTKVGRVSATKSDYSPDWIRSSVARSLQRLRTSYLDVVFCHDIELVEEESVLKAIGVLLELVDAGKVRYIGVSGYPIDTLARVARRARKLYGRPLDVIQNWAQMTLQNDRLEREGLQAFKEAGVNCVCNSSPLASGLLRGEGVPIAALGDWHPAPEGLRRAAHAAAVYVASQGEVLARLALRYALRRAQHCSTSDVRVGTIMGGTTVAEIEENVTTALKVLQRSNGRLQWSSQGIGGWTDNRDAQLDQHLSRAVQQILGKWKNYSFSDGKTERKEDVVQTKL